MNTRKAQAALEFLMTYGWAILVVLIAIGALAFFGVLSPERFLPAKCTLQPGLACADHKVTPGQITVVIKNGYGADITVDSMSAQNCVGVVSPALPVSLANGAQTTFDIPCTTPITTSKYSGILNITYTNADSGLQRSNIGDIVGSVE
jgi:hypothetical protein